MNCTKKRDARAELMFCLSKLIAFLVFSSTSPSSMLILPIIKSQCRLKFSLTPCLHGVGDPGLVG